MQFDSRLPDLYVVMRQLPRRPAVDPEQSTQIGMSLASPSDYKEFTPRRGGRKILLRRLQSFEDYHACVLLQEETWGKGFPDRVPASILMVSRKIGGLAAGAFDDAGSMIGFVFGMTGFKEERPVHWSDMLAVHPTWRDAGIGTQLKLFQRTEVLKLGISEIYWTFDPLVARNAHLNLVRLGAEIEEYVPDMYPDAASELHRDLGMDRCIAVWKIASPRVEAIVAGVPPPLVQPEEEIPVVNSERHPSGHIFPSVRPLPATSSLLIEVPRDIYAVRDASVEVARGWRESTRHAFLHSLRQGYRVSSFVRGFRENRFFYLLTL